MHRPQGARTIFENTIEGLALGTGCWIWTGRKNRYGYGRINQKLADNTYRHFLAHRMVYELVVGPIPKGLELDHLCRNPLCVRPDHLDPVTHGENMRRAGPFNRWTHCAKGHELINQHQSDRSKYRCAKCRKINERTRAARLRREGRCSCGRVPEVGYKSCRTCINKAIVAQGYEPKKPVPAKERA